MTEQFYINGVLMDMKSGSPASLVFQSPFFLDIDNIVSNRTNSVSFPATKNNLEAVDSIHLSGSGSKFAYRRHKVLYFRDGVQIFSGYGTLLSVTPSELKFSFTWGNVSIFQKLLDYKIRELREKRRIPDIPVPWNDKGVKNSEYYASNLKTGGYAHPMMKATLLLDEIERTCGVTFENKNLFKEYRIPLLGIEADEYAKRLQGVVLSETTYREERTNQYYHWFAVGPLDKDVMGLYLGNGIFDVEKFENVKIIFSSDFMYSVPAFTGNSEQSIRIYASTEDGKSMQQLYSIPLKKKATSRFVYALGLDLNNTKEVVLDVSRYSYLRIQVFVAGLMQTSATPTFLTGKTNIIPDYNKEQKLIYGGIYPMFKNLPDWTVSKLLKNLMKMEGLFPVCVDDKTIRFVSVDVLYKNRENAYDITDMAILENNSPAEKTFTFGSFARNNYFRYADDDTVSVDATGKITIQDSTLDESADVMNLDFAASDEKDGEVLIPIYKSDGKGGYEYDEVEPRILKVTASSSSEIQERVTFQGLDWMSLITSKYSKYANIIQNAKMIKTSVLIGPVDLAKLDLTVPVYSFALGHYYAINKMTTKNDGVADVELLQLGKEEDKEESIVSGKLNLTIVPRPEGGYCATLSNRSISEINLIRSDENYKVCLIRYGYARRGKFERYMDKTGVKTTTKTSRKSKYDKKTKAPGYRYVRFQEGKGTPCWRIIGHDLLYLGRIADHSQTLKYYGESTLVFELFDRIILPPMRKRCRKKSGRISNTAAEGLAELSVALYHKNDKGVWEIVSNICHVRSRTETKTQYWDFDESNVLSV